MKAFALALIVLAIMAIDASADAGWVQMSAHDARSWAVADTMAIFYAGCWLWNGRKR